MASQPSQWAAGSRCRERLLYRPEGAGRKWAVPAGSQVLPQVCRCGSGWAEPGKCSERLSVASGHTGTCWQNWDPQTRSVSFHVMLSSQLRSLLAQEEVS